LKKLVGTNTSMADNTFSKKEPLTAQLKKSIANIVEDELE